MERVRIRQDGAVFDVWRNGQWEFLAVYPAVRCACPLADYHPRDKLTTTAARLWLMRTWAEPLGLTLVFED